jgi:hypothetical protein
MQSNPYLNYPQQPNLAQFDYPSKLEDPVTPTQSSSQRKTNDYFGQGNPHADFSLSKPNAVNDVQQLKLQQTIEECQRKLYQLDLQCPKLDHKKQNSTMTNPNLSYSTPKNPSKQANIVTTGSVNNTTYGLLRTVNVPATPLKVNVSEIITNAQNKSVTRQDGPSSQVSSDSGYGGGPVLSQSTINTSKESNDPSQSPNDLSTSMPYSATFCYLNVKIAKNPGLGFSITGGKGFVGNPFKANDPVCTR